MQQVLRGVVVIGFVIGGAWVTAQAPSEPAAKAAVVEKLDDLELARLQTVQFAGKRANDACQSQEAVKEYNQVRQQVQTMIETKHKNFTVDWGTFALIPKPAAKAAASPPTK